ncbi:NADH-ubiquinone oxidoreductase-F iron-sulfur binding region domain-containing protein [Nocardia violaceofusca]|uniref:NADH-ubiquinone oxidoreductase-F iron-sulfur binding region domain-containing protein n=1 Tax=Nocardia violaceofusca TaxID=941182 RepID=UPI0007A46F46|nr:NADH-ubiquinone oxidoreductase-F iron-sulfur binding region domain-containing protein [Nocardia violaceofusca]
MTGLPEMLAAAGLRGRGGANFPTAAKLELAARHRAELIVNACDGEWDSAKDAWVVAHHLPEVLDGARRITAQRVRVAAHRGSRTLAVLEAAGVDTLAVPRRYVSSEESALVRLAHGGPARPVMRFEPITGGGRDPRGRRLAPTLVLNVETVWRIQQIAEYGPGWFRSYGTADEPGPRLVTVADGVRAPGVHAAEAGLPVSEILDRAGGLTASPQALWVNGLSGGFLPAEARHTLWSRSTLAPFGLGPGVGTFRVLAAGSDPWQVVLSALTYAAGESAGQCGPCMFGLPALRDDLSDLLERRASAATAERLLRRLTRVPGRGACRFPDGVARFLASALDVFGTPQLVESPGSERFSAHKDESCP